MKSVKELLRIDEKEALESIERYIRSYVNEHGASGVVMGLSGGIDSALLATLAVRILGKENVRVYFLHDKNSEKDSEEKARLMAGWLRLELRVGSIEAAMREREKDASFFKWLSVLPQYMLPVMASLYYVIVGETPYMTTLRKAELKKSRFRRWIYKNIVSGLEDMFDGPCEERRIMLEKVAREENLILVGTGNRSEDLTGWFTPKGVDNMPCSPIKSLYKTQVWQVAEYLEIPDVILKRVPSADVLKGATDTLALGMDFEKIDIILYGIEHELNDEEMMEYGVSKQEIKRIRDINRMSAWRRSPLTEDNAPNAEDEDNISGRDSNKI